VRLAVRDVMSPDPVTVRGEDSGQEAASTMCRERVQHLPVLDRHGLLVGIVTDRDLRHHLLSPAVVDDLGRIPTSALLERVRVSDVMSAPAFVTSPEAPLSDAVKLMRERRFGALPVVEGRRLVGMLTESDLLRRILAAGSADHDVDRVVVPHS
jgi:CBS domain-containing protein